MQASLSSGINTGTGSSCDNSEDAARVTQDGASMRIQLMVE